MVSPSIAEATPATSARAAVASRHRAMVRVRMDTACHGWGKKKAPRTKPARQVDYYNREAVTDKDCNISFKICQ